jgi:hypothetical protein
MDFSRQTQQQGECMLRNGIRRVRQDYQADASFLGAGHIDAVHADAGTDDQPQKRGGFEGRAVQANAAADDHRLRFDQQSPEFLGARMGRDRAPVAGSETSDCLGPDWAQDNDVHNPLGGTALGGTP